MIYTLFSCFVSFLFDSTTLTLHPTHAVVETSMRGIQKSPFNLLIYFENDFELISYEWGEGWGWGMLRWYMRHTLALVHSLHSAHSK